MNKVFLFGSLGVDPELRMTGGGTAVMKLRMATTERFKDKDGQWKDRTEWHRVVVWGKRAESLSKFLQKGSRLLIQGSLRTTSYDGKDGKKVYTTEIVADDVQLAEKQQRGEAGGRPVGRGHQSSYAEPERGGSDDDDIPF